MQGSIAKIEHAERGQAVVDQAVKALNAGKLLVFPTETVYGIAASVMSENGLKALYEFKQRPQTQPFTIHLPDPESSSLYTDISDRVIGSLVRKGFPGPLTLVTDVSNEVIGQKINGLGLGMESVDRLYFDGTVGLRCPDSTITRRILAAVKGPVVASSANRRGELPPYTAEAAAEAVGGAVELVVDDGPCRFSKPSTIVRVRQVDQRTKIKVVRQGVMDERMVHELTTWTMLLVCSGNTCRSPMAEGIAKSILSEHKGLNVDDLGAAGFRVVSAGAFAAAGAPPSAEAVEALIKGGIDISGHRSQPLTVELIKQADVIYCMGQAHYQAVLTMVRSAEGKTQLLDPSGDIDDPIGSSLTIYQRCAELIRRRLVSRIQEQKV